MKLDLRKMSQIDLTDIDDPWVIEIEILGRDGEALEYTETVGEEADIEAMLRYELEEEGNIASMIEETAFGLRFRFDDFDEWQLAKKVVKAEILDSEYDGRMLAGVSDYYYRRPPHVQNCPGAEDWYSNPGIAPDPYERYWNRKIPFYVGEELMDEGDPPPKSPKAYVPEVDYEFEEE